MSAVRVGLLVVAGAASTLGAAQHARRVRLRAALIGRVANVAPPDVRPARSLDAWLRAQPRRLVIAAGAALAGGTYVAGPVLGVLAAAAVAAAPLGLRAYRASRADAAYEAALVSALDGLARSVRSGASLPQAIAEAATSVRGAVADDLAHAAAAIARGRGFAEALAEWRDARPRPSVRLTVGALVLASTTGGPPARVVEDVASAIRSRQQVAREATSLAAQARMSALVVGLAPLGFTGLMCVTDPRNAQLLFGTGIGIACVVAGLTLDAIGAVWMHRMSARVAL